MDEFVVEFFVDNGKDKVEKIPSLNEKQLEDWKAGVELRALGEYYNKKINTNFVVKMEWILRAIYICFPHCYLCFVYRILEI